MTTPFTTFAFPATGTPTDRTLPDRLVDIFNVKDFAARGDGVTDDWAAIMAAYNHGQVTLVTTANAGNPSFASNQTSAFTGVISSNVLTASSVTGTITVGDFTLNAGNFAVVLSQDSGTPGGAGTYTLSSTPDVASGAMTTFNSVLTFASVPAGLTARFFAVDVTTPSAFDLPVNSFVNGSIATTATTVPISFLSRLVAAGDTITFNLGNKGTIFFPVGTYRISQSIDLKNSSNFIITAAPGATITGNFGDAILKRLVSVYGGNATLSAIENLTIINEHAAGEGVRIASVTLTACRNLNVTANKGIFYTLTDTSLGPYYGLDCSIDSCRVDAGANVSGSIGISSGANGPVINCQIIGYESGGEFFGNEGYMNILGCYFERNIIALNLGISEDGSAAASSSLIVSGCWFKDNGIAIAIPANPLSGGTGGALFSGIEIEASEDVIVGGQRPQYGIYATRAGACLFAGVTVKGQYDQYGIAFESATLGLNQFFGVQSFNTSTQGGLGAWKVHPAIANYAQFGGCNVSPVYTMSELPTTLSGFPVLEGDAFNVSDSNSATWGATAAGGGSTHAKVRWNGSAWSVVGK